MTTTLIKKATLLGGMILLQATAFSTSRVADLIAEPHSVQDTVIMEDVKTGEKKKVRIYTPGSNEIDLTIIKGDSIILETTESTSIKKNSSKNRSGGIFGVGIYRIDLGLTKPIGPDGFSMTGENEILKYRPGKTMNFGFDVIQAGYRFNKNFRIFLSGGFDWTYYRLRNDLIFDPNGSPYETHEEADAPLKKNRLTSTYLRLPLAFEYRTNHSSSSNRIKISAGPVAGFLLKGTQRYKMEGVGKVKRKGDHDFATFQYGAFARFQVGNLGAYSRYYFNDIFENSPDGAGLQNFTFGLTFDF